MTLPRERATYEADLPHRFTAPADIEACTVCGGALVSSLHAAWEQAAVAASVEPVTIPRERGV